MYFIEIFSLLMLSSCKHQGISCSSVLSSWCSKLWRTNCETRKWQLHEQVGDMFMFAVFSPTNSMLFLFIFLQMRHLMQTGIMTLSKSFHIATVELFSPSQASCPEAWIVQVGTSNVN